jgi:hypothetical protein
MPSLTQAATQWLAGSFASTPAPLTRWGLLQSIDEIDLIWEQRALHAKQGHAAYKYEDKVQVTVMTNIVLASAADGVW